MTTYPCKHGVTQRCGLCECEELDGGQPAESPSVEAWLVEENRQLRKAGCKLAEAAIRVVREHDGCHRLMLAVSEWATAVANEGGRGKD